MLNLPAGRQVPNIQNARTAANIIEKRMILRVCGTGAPATPAEKTQPRIMLVWRGTVK
jgi:hypothetical protein